MVGRFERSAVMSYGLCAFMSSVQNYIFKIRRLINVVISFLFLWSSPVFAVDIDDKALTLLEAEKIALDNDPLVARSESMRDEMAFRSTDAFSWPDPKIKLGVVNFSTEEFNFEKEAMTQAVVGIQQMFPPAGAVAAKRDELSALSEAFANEIDQRKLESSRNIRHSWLAVYLQYHSQKLVHESLSVFGQLKKITRLQYRNGQGAQADVIRAQLEESLLLDKEIDLSIKYEKAMADLKHGLNVKELNQSLDMSMPDLPNPPEGKEIDKILNAHPLLKSSESRVKAAKSGVEFANAQFHPGWSLDVSYGYRAGNRSDLVSAVMMFELPLFTGSKQSRQLQASQSSLSSAKYSLDDRRRQLRRRYEDGLSLYTRTSERLSLYDTQLLPEAEQNTEATLSSYQNSVSAFDTVIRARLTQLQSQLQRLKLKVAKADAQVELLYLAGGR